MKTKLLKRSVALMACGMTALFPVFADELKPALVVWDGETELYSFYVSNEPVLKVANGNAVIQSDGVWGTYDSKCYYSIPMSETSKYKITLEQRDYMGDFGAQVPTSVTEAPTVKNKPAFSLKNGILSVSGLKAGEPLMVFTVDGKTVAQAKADANGQASTALRQMPGTVIVKAGRVSFKVMVR